MEKGQIKVYAPKYVILDLDNESKNSGETKSFIVTEAIKKELKRRGKK